MVVCGCVLLLLLCACVCACACVCVFAQIRAMECLSGKPPQVLCGDGVCPPPSSRTMVL